MDDVSTHAAVAVGLANRSGSATSSAQGDGMRITFKELTYSVPSFKDARTPALLLKGVSGYLEPAQMTALMGPSGSGKTTLLDLLAGRKTTGSLEGDIRFAGQRPSSEFLKRFAGYVEQFDTLIPILTVREMLMYTAELKRPVSEPTASKAAAVDGLLAKLSLERCAPVLIGSSLARGISGGQAKRTNIGIALITNPRVLFLDEPTTGLDSFTANEVMTVVKSLVADGTTICATIHSPTGYCFSLFDRMMMLVRGELLYFGPLATALHFFDNNGGSAEMHAKFNNPAEFIVELVTDADRLGSYPELAAAYGGSPLCADNLAFIEHHASDKLDVSEATLAELAVRHATVTPWWYALKILLQYRTLKNLRNGDFMGPRIGSLIFIALLILTLYSGVGNNFAPSNIVNISAMLYMWFSMPGFAAASYVPTLVLDRGLFVRERSDGLYRVITYLLFKMLEELAVAGIGSAIVCSWVFYACWLKGTWVLFWLAHLITYAWGIVLAFFVSAVSPNIGVANAALPVFVVVNLFFAGFLFRLNDIPPWWRWFSFIDIFRYGWTANMVNQFEDNNLPYLAGKTIMEFYAVDNVRKWDNIGYMALFYIVFFCLTWLALSYSRYQRR